MDPLAEVAALPGVGQAATSARDAFDVVTRHPALRRQAAAVAARAGAAGAQAAATLQRWVDGGTGPAAQDGVVDPVLAGALQVTSEAGRLGPALGRTPLQALARLHLLAAGGLASPEQLGRPAGEAAAARLQTLGALLAGGALTGPSSAPGVVVASLVHAELACLPAFEPAGVLVALAAERAVLVGRGVDPAAVAVPEVGHAAEPDLWQDALQAYRTGTDSGVAHWVRRCCVAYQAGAAAGLAIAQAVVDQPE
jgi:hypothetical protein